MNKSLVSLLVLFVFPMCVLAQGNDLYQKEYIKMKNEKYTQERNAVLKIFKTMYFALECKVFTSEVFITPMLGSLESTLFEKGITDSILDKDLQKDILNASEAGVSKGREPNACDYWKKNPEEVYKVRKYAQMYMH